MAGEAIIGGIAATLIAQLCRDWAQEIGQAAMPVRDLLGKEELISNEELSNVSRTLAIVVHSLAAGSSKELLDLLIPFYEEQQQKMSAMAAANCDCPKHRAEREAAGLAG